MEFHVDVHKKIKKDNLNQYQYTISLLQEGYRVGLLDQQMILNLQNNIVLILKKLILKYTKKESTSVKTDIAVEIYNSILYALDMELASFKNPDESLKHLLTVPIQDIYQAGFNRLQQLFEDTKQLFKYIKDHKLNISLSVYQSSIEEAIPLFFRNYNIKYDALNTMTIVDYPLLFDDMKYKGLVYINNYLQHLKLETEFIHYFHMEDVITTLENFGLTYQMDYKEAFINIFEIVLNNAICSAIIRDDVSHLHFSISDYNILENKLKKASNKTINLIIDEAVNKMITQLDITNYYLINYIERYKYEFIQRLKNAIKNNALFHIIITDKNKLKKEIIALSSKQGMSNGEFRQFVIYLNELQSVSEKISAIKSSIQSLDDLIDLLSSDCLYGNEYLELYQKLSSLELAVLGKMVFYEALRDNSFSLAGIHKCDVQYEWEELFIKYMDKLNIEQKNELIKLMNGQSIEINR